MNFREFLASENTITFPAAIPTVTKVSPIRAVEYKKNPIAVYLTDGTRLSFTAEEFRRIPGRPPAVGRMMTVVFQRHPQDVSEIPSKIESVRVD